MGITGKVADDRNGCSHRASLLERCPLSASCCFSI